MQPTMCMDRSTQTLNLQLEIKAMELEEMIYLEFTHKDINDQIPLPLNIWQYLVKDWWRVCMNVAIFIMVNM